MVSRHVRSNVVAYLALFFALTGSAAALQGKNSVKAKDIAKNAVTSPKIAAGAVTAPKLAQGSVGAGAIAAGAVGAPAISSGAIGADELAAGAVGTTKLAAGAVGTSELANGSVTTGKLGTAPAVHVAGVLSQTAPAIAPTAVQLDTNNVYFNNGGFGVSSAGITVPLDGVYFLRLVVPWGDDPDNADRQFVAQLFADGDLVQTASARATQDVGFNYGPSTDASGLFELTAGDQVDGEVYYSGASPTGGIPLAGLGPTFLEAFWVGPA